MGLHKEQLNMATHFLATASPYSDRQHDMELFAQVTDVLGHEEPLIRVEAAQIVSGALGWAEEHGCVTVDGRRLMFAAIAAAQDRVETGFTAQTAAEPVVVHS